MLEIDTTVMVLVDLQEKLLAAMHEREALVEQTRRLLAGATVLGVPVLHTEQNPAALGRTVLAVADLLDGDPIEKMVFSCGRHPGFTSALAGTGRRQVLLAGIEAHVCIYQTAADLAATGYEVQVVADAVSSRTPANKAVGLGRAAAAGAVVTSVETALFELLGTADDPRFRDLLKIVK